MAFDQQGRFYLTEDDARQVFLGWCDRLKLSHAQFAEGVGLSGERFHNWLRGTAPLTEAELQSLNDASEELINAERVDVERDLANYGFTAGRNSWSTLGLMGKK